MDDHFSFQQRSDVVTRPESPILNNYVYLANIMPGCHKFAPYAR